ncbi:MAG: ABC transporter permease [Deltaproteobacteria bacterium]|nr:ABC transporter permease [Deltaproteobacteria bacterium]
MAADFSSASAEVERPTAPERVARLVRRLIVPGAVLAVWQVVVAAGWVPPASLPSPAAVVEAWWVWVAGPVTPLAWYSGTWWLYLLMSLRRVAAGFAIAAAAGVGLGVLIGWYAAMEDLFDGVINFLRAVPMTAWVPFAVFFFGIHESAAVFLIGFGSFFPIVVNTAAGARQTPRILIRAARMLGTRPRKLLVRVVLPTALPAIFTGLRVGLGLAWVLVIVAEMLAVQGGLGYALWSAYQFSRLDLILAAITSVGVLGLASDRLVSATAGRVLRWQRGLTGL